MKKLVLVVAIAVVATSFASAQLFVSGSVGFDYQLGRNTRGAVSIEQPATFLIDFSPAVGYYLSDRLAIGGQIGLGYKLLDYRQDTERKEKTFSWSIQPFVRERVFVKGDFGVWLESGIMLYGDTNKEKYGNQTNDGTKGLGFAIGVLPLLTYNLTDRISLEASSDFLSIGFLSYRDKWKSGDTTNKNANSYFGMGVNAGSENIQNWWLKMFDITVTYKF